MSKARDLADTVSTGGILDDGTVTVSEISDLTVTAAELNNVAGVNSDVQTQLDLKAPLASPSFTGNVGVGTSSPSGKLTLKAGDNTYAGGFRLEGTDETTALAITHVNGDNYFSGNATDDHLVLTGSGNVGIGTSSMGYPNLADNLTISDSANSGITIRSGNTSEGSIYFSDETGSGAGTYAGYINYSHSSSKMRIATNSTLAATIDSSGSVGIGTDSPLAKLTTIDTTDATKQIVFGNNTTYYGSIGHDAGTGANLYTTETAGNHKFMNGTTERLRIGTSGEIGIGGANYGTSGQVLTSGGSGAAPTWADAAAGGAAFSGF